MTYKEVLKDFYADNPFTQISKNAQLYWFMKQLSENSKMADIIISTWNEKHNNTAMMHPDQLIDHCKIELGFDTYKSLEEFWLAVDKSKFNFKNIINIFNPKFPEIGETETIANIHVDYYIRNVGFPIDPFKINIGSDNEYELLSKEDLLKVIKTNPSNKYSGIKEKRDCDDFTRIFLGWLSEKGFGNLGIFELRATLVYNSGETAFHSMCLSLTKEKEVWIFEPQNDHYIWKFGDPVNWPNVARIEPFEINE